MNKDDPKEHELIVVDGITLIGCPWIQGSHWAILPNQKDSKEYCQVCGQKIKKSETKEPNAT